MAAAAASDSGGLSKSCILIIVVASVERFAYKGVASNLVTYLTDVVKLSTSSAAKNVNTWCGVTSMLPLLGAFLADSYWDRYSTILASSLLYILGLVSLTIWALLWAFTPISKTIFAAALFASLYLISMAQGGYNPCLQAFGAEQLEREEGKEMNGEKKSKFFQWWYFGICTGSLMGVTLMSYIQDNFGWGWGFAIPTIGMALSAICFSSGTPLYVRKKITKVRDQTIIEAVLRSFKEALKKVVPAGTIRLPSRKCYDEEVAELELQDNKPLMKEDSVADSVSREEEPGAEVRAIVKLLPVWAMLLAFAVIFQQPATFFTKQGTAMRRNIWGERFTIPPATLQSAITLSIILLMPLYDHAIVPAFRLLTGNEKGITVLQRIAVGMFLSVLAMVVAALVEAKRLGVVARSRAAGGVVPPLPPPLLSIFWLLPQYILLGVSDVFTVVGMQEFFYARVPKRMRSVGIAMYLSVFGVGSFLSAILITVIEMVTSSSSGCGGWFSDDMGEARLDNYYWLLALSSSISLISFLALTRHYTD